MAHHHDPRTFEANLRRRRRRRRSLLLLLLGLAAAPLTLGQSAVAAKPYPIDGGGMGVYQFVGDAGAAVSGTFTGKPFDGSYVGGFTADDGSLPAPGDCEPATATLRVDGTRGRFVDMTATGNVCGKWTSPTYVVTHTFTGRYVVDASSSRRLVGTDGFMSQLVANTGLANVYTIATD